MSGDLYKRLQAEFAESRKDAGALFPGMTEAHFAYHVVNVERVFIEEQAQGAQYDQFRKSFFEPGFEKLRWSLADDPKYDGALVGLPCVFFQTSVWVKENERNLEEQEKKLGKGETEFQQKYGLPSKSPYPSYGGKGKQHWRVMVPLSYFANHKAWYCVNPAKSRKGVHQIRLVLTDGDKEHAYFQDQAGFIELNLRELNPFLCCLNGRWFTNNHANNLTDYVTNFVVLKDFWLKDESWRDLPGIKWDSVERDERLGIGQPIERDQFAAGLSEQWSHTFKQAKEIFTKKR